MKQNCLEEILSEDRRGVEEIRLLRRFLEIPRRDKPDNRPSILENTVQESK